MTREETTGAGAEPSGRGPRAPFEGPGAMRAACRAFDWSATPLGDVEAWPASLRTTAETVLATAFPAVVLWGPELVQLYNDAYVPFLGVKHPGALGQPTRACWPEVWHLNAPIYARARRGETVYLEDACYPVLRHGADGPLEELYLTISYSPVRDETGDVAGIFVTLVDTTAQVVGRAAQAEHQRIETQVHGALLDTALVIDQVRDAYFVMDGEFRILSVNESAERVLRRPRSALLGRTHWEAFPASLGAEPERQYRQVASDRVEAHFVHHYVGEGFDIHVEVDAYPALDGGIAVFWRDISDRVRLLADVEAARAEAVAARVDAETRAATLEAVIDSIPDAVLVGRAGAVTLANRAALEQLDVPSVEALQASAPTAALPLDELLLDPETGAVLPLAATPIGRAFVGERSHGQFLLRARGTAAVHPVRAAAAPIPGPNGAILGAVAVLTDMTRVQAAAAERERLLAEHVQARREIERLLGESERARADAESARAEAERADRAKAEFLAMMSHELRTPLNAIGGYAGILELGLRGPVTEQQRADLARIQESERHLLGLVNEILDLAKVDSGQLRVEREQVRSGDTVDAALALVRPQAVAKALSVVEMCGSAADRPYLGDEPRVRQVLVNLLANAVKFTAPGGRVAVTCALTDAPPSDAALAADTPYVALRVEDTGVGIAPDQLARIFEPFSQAEGGLTRPRSGTGLGLAISRRLARLMGGDVTVESRPGVGSTFTLWLPTLERRAQPRVPANAELASAELASARRASAQQASDPPTGGAEGAAGDGRHAGSALPSSPAAMVGAVPGLAQIGEGLVAEVGPILRAWVARVRTDAEIPDAAARTDAELEDHGATFVTDVAIALRTMGQSDGDAAALLRDGTAILALIAERHGAQRARLGWSPGAILREFALLREITDAAVQRLAASVLADAAVTARASSVVAHLLDQGTRLSLGGYRLVSGAP